MGAGEKNLKIVAEGIQADVKVINLKGKSDPRKVNGKPIKMKEGSPVITYMTSTGDPVEFVRVKDGQVVENLSNAYREPKSDTLYQVSELIAHYETKDGELIPAEKNEKTDVYEITSWEPIENYMNRYQMRDYYGIQPSQGESKKDYDRKIARNMNTMNLKKLWDMMMERNIIGKGRLNITSSGYLPSVAYLRAVEINGNWTFEISVFKEKKQFKWCEEKDFKPVEVKMGKGKVKVEDI